MFVYIIVNEIKGNYNIKNNEQINEILPNYNELKEKIKNYEQPIKNYYTKYLEDFFLNNLFRKKSTNSDYKELVETFSLMINEVKEINNSLVFQRCSLYEYEKYLNEKNTIINNQERFGKFFDSTNKVVASLEQEKKRDIENLNEVVEDSITLKEMEPPENIYRNARKIDWESLNKQKNLTGSQGEIIALVFERDYLIKTGHGALAEKVKHVAKEQDGLGYDILSYFPDGSEKYIEVKSTIKDKENSFYISKNELNFLQQNLKSTFIYRIYSVNGYDTNPVVEIKSAQEVLNGQIIPTQFLIKPQ